MPLRVEATAFSHNPGVNGRRRNLACVCFLGASIWILNLIWLSADVRPPVWDMAMHQSYALNYLPGRASEGRAMLEPWARSGTYPPFVHLAIAFCYFLLHPGPHVAALANIPATFLLLWAVFELASDMAGPGAARWACFITGLTPYLIWMSRETILDYWLSAWVAVSLVILRHTEGFKARVPSVLLGFCFALGMLTKWFFAGFLLFPLLYIFFRERLWRYEARLINLLDALIIAGGLCSLWYLPNLPRLARYFEENLQVGALEGEPSVVSFQSVIYYLRLLEGYQLFALLFCLLAVSSIFVWRKRLLNDGKFLCLAIVGGWLFVTLLRTKDPRFTMPLLGLLAILPGAWIQSWPRTWICRASQVALVAFLCFQVYLTNFGFSWLPEQVVLAKGYQGSFRWDWNLYLQHYFHILGPPRREDWKQPEILRRVVEDAARNGLRKSLALIPDLPRFSAANFYLYTRLLRLPVRVEHLRSATQGVRSFDGFDYVLMTEGDQGVSWTTGASRALNQIVVDEHDVFLLVELFPMPNGDSVRLYSIRRGERFPGQ